MPQGTVKTFDPATLSGTLLDDHLRERTYDRQTFTASGLQELRVGQRVRFQLEGPDDAARVTQLNLVSL
jgi:cold shock CspA family protein